MDFDFSGAHVIDIKLRPDQQQLKNEIYRDWNAGAKNVMAVLPTGGGKSIVMSDIAKDLNDAKLRFPVIAHRNELVSQMSHHLMRRDIPHQIIGSNDTIRQIIASHREECGMSYVNPTALPSVAGIDTINARADVLKEWGRQQDYFFNDEGHHVLAKNKWGRGIGLLTNARGLLVTASPARPDGQGLGREYDGIVDTMVLGPDMRWLIDHGALADYEIVCPQSDLHMSDDDISDSGDYSPKKLKAAAEKSKIVGDVVKEYVRYALFKRAICFATDVETATKIAQKFNDAGIKAAAVSAKTPTNVREKYIREFKSGKIYVLVNVDLFDEGFDVPACDCVIMARPTASLVKYLQMFGRALRTAAGKMFGLIIDHVSNVIKHGLPDKPRQWSLARREKRGKQEKDPDDIPMMRCMSEATNPPCRKPYPRIEPRCPFCGWEPPLPEPGGRTVEMVDGDLVLLDRAKLEQMRKAMNMPSAGAVASQAAHVAGPLAGAGAANRQMEKIAEHKRLWETIEQWAGIERARGLDDQRIHKKFYLAVGMTVLDVLDASRTRQEFAEMADKVERWYS